MLIHGAAAMLPLGTGRTRAALLRATTCPSSTLAVGSRRPSHPSPGCCHMPPPRATAHVPLRYAAQQVTGRRRTPALPRLALPFASHAPPALLRAW